MSDEYKHLSVEFYVEPIEDPKATAEQGRPIFNDVEFVRIRAAGSRDMFVAPAHDQSSKKDPNNGRRLTYAQLHFGPYEAFKRGIEFRESGTPLSELTNISAAKRKELNAVNVYTVEQLAALDGASLAKLGMGGRGLKTLAQEYISKATGVGAMSKLAQENEDLKARLARLEAMMVGAIPVQEEPAGDVSDSPFAEWGGDDIRAWLKDNKGPTPGPNTSLAKLIQIADGHNAALKKQKEAA
jgi:hypothetical protein